jgi:transcriptional regulator with XRE-family HTH domain
MSAGRLFTIQNESEDMISARRGLLNSLRDREYRRFFVAERVRSSTALQIRALREERNMSQAALGAEIGMAQTWISKLENPDYGKLTVATLLRLADAFDTDLEIKFRPFTTTINTLPRQGPEYFRVPGFNEEFLVEKSDINEADLSKLDTGRGQARFLGGSATTAINGSSQGRTLNRQPMGIASASIGSAAGSQSNNHALG